MQRKKIAQAAVWSASLTVICLTILVIVAEQAAGVKNWLAETFFHHWLGKGILGIVFFVVMTLLLTAVRSRDDTVALRRGLALLAWVAAISTVVLVGFFWHEAA